MWLETWLTDQEMEFISDENLPPCPEGCTKCIDACATGSLAEPYQMTPFTCTSMLSWGGSPNTLPPENLRGKMKGWLYGCDDCQNCCPMNEGCWADEEEFPGLEALSEILSLEKLLTLDDETLAARLSPVFFFVGPDKVWKWKVHALQAMAYEYRPGYLPYIDKARGDKNALVREMAEWAYGVIGTQG